METIDDKVNATPACGGHCGSCYNIECGYGAGHEITNPNNLAVVMQHFSKQYAGPQGIF